MASFNQDVRLKEPDSFLRYSQGPGVDSSLGKLFENVGENVELAAKGANMVVESKIKEEAHKAVDTLRNEQTEALELQTEAILGIPQEGKNVPMAINQYRTRLAKLQAARDSGQMTGSETDYWLKVNAATKQMYAQYGAGYREEIDKAIVSTTGRNPANALMEARRKDLDEFFKKSNSENEKYQNFVRTNAKELHVAGVTLAEALNIPPGPQRDHIYNEIQKVEGEKFKNEIDLQKILVEEKTNENRATKAAGVLSQMFANEVEKELRGIDNAVSKQYPGGISQMFLDYNANKLKSTPEQRIEVANQLTEVKARLESKFEGFLSRQDPATGRSLRSLITTSKGSNYIKQLSDEALGRLKSFEEAFTNEKYDIAYISEQHRKAKENAVMDKVLDLPGMAIANAVNKAGLKDIYMTMMTATGSEGNKLMENTVRAINALIAQDSAKITAVKPSLDHTAPAVPTFDQQTSKAVEEFRKAGDEQGLKTYLNNKLGFNVAVLTDPKVPEETVVQHAEHMFNSGTSKFISALPRNEQLTIFGRLANKKVADALAARKNSDLWTNYRQWTYITGFDLFQKEINEAKQPTVFVNPYVSKLEVPKELYFDPEVNQFRAKVAGASTAIAGNFFQGDLQTRLDNHVVGVNRLIKMLEPVIKAENGDIQRTLGEFFAGVGVDMAKTTPSPDKADPLSRMVKALQELIKVEEEPVKPTPKKKGVQKPEFIRPGNRSQGEIPLTQRIDETNPT